MTDASETLSLRVTVIAGQRHPDDFEVIWRGIAIGRIMRASDATPGKPRNGRGAATLAGRKAPTTEGPASTSTTPRRISETAWARIRASLTDQDIADAHRIAKNSAEAIARYDRKRGT